MKKILSILILFLVLIMPVFAIDSEKKDIDAHYQSNGVYENTINPANEYAKSVSEVNESIKKNMDAQTKLLKYQAVQQGIDIFDANDIREQQYKIYTQSRFYLQLAKEEAILDNDEEMLNLINKYWKWWRTNSAIIAAQKVRELKEKRKNMQIQENESENGEQVIIHK